MNKYEVVRNYMFKVPNALRGNLDFTKGFDPLESHVEVVFGSDYSYCFVAPEKVTRLSAIQKRLLEEFNLKPGDYEFITIEEWIKAVTDIYYKEAEGEWTKKTLYEYGRKTTRNGARQIVKKNKPQEGLIVEEIFQAFKTDKTLDWTLPHDRQREIAPMIPNVLAHRTSKIYKEVLFKIKE